MNKYNKTIWQDEIVQYPNRYSETKDETTGYVTLTEQPGEVAQQGTLVNAQRMNNIESGISQLYNAWEKSFSLTLLASNWTQNTTTNHYEYNVVKTGITSNTDVTVNADLENQEKLSIGHTESYDGGFKIVVKDEVTEDAVVTVTYQLVESETVAPSDSEVAS